MGKKIGLDISVLNDQNKTGIGVYTYNLIDAVLRQDREDQFVLFGIATLSSYDYLSSLFNGYPNVEKKIFKWPAKLFRTSFLVWQKLNFPPIEAFIGPVDMFHSFNWYFPPQSKGKKIATVFDMTAISHPEWHQEKTSQLDLLRFEKIAKNADLTVAISKSARKDFLKFSPASKVEVIYPAVRENLLGKDGKGVLEKYGLKPGYFLSVATLEPRKNLEGLIQAYLQTDIKEPLVLVGGAGWKSDKLSQFARENPNIILPGFVPDKDLPALYKNASCFVYPSFYEGFGMPVLEAMELGAPVICSETSSLPEVGGEAVIYVDPYSLKSIKEGLLEVLDEKKRQRMIKAGLKQVKKFSWEKSAEKLIRLYRG